MTNATAHAALIAAAAKRHLGAIGLKRKGQSRLWFKDNGWWVSLVEFQPSSWAKGSYLNVGAMWLWHAKDSWSFDEGGRVEAFHAYESDDQFASAAEALAARAREETLLLSERFSSPPATAHRLANKPNNSPWNSFHAGMAALAADRPLDAQARFNALLQFEEHASWVWVTDLQSKVRTFLDRLKTVSSRDLVAEEIMRARALLKLSPVEPGKLWVVSDSPV